MMTMEIEVVMVILYKNRNWMGHRYGMWNCNRDLHRNFYRVRNGPVDWYSDWSVHMDWVRFDYRNRYGAVDRYGYGYFDRIGDGLDDGNSVRLRNTNRNFLGDDYALDVRLCEVVVVVKC